MDQKYKKQEITSLMKAVLDKTSPQDWEIEDRIFYLSVELKECKHICLIRHYNCGPDTYSYNICGVDVGWWNFRKVKKQFKQILSFYKQKEREDEKIQKEKLINNKISLLKEYLNKKD